MSTDSLTITSATGVDVKLAIAGPGSRSHAFIIDWHIRLLLALTWFAIAAYVQTGVFYLRGKSAGAVAAITLLPAMAIYFLYHPLVELAMRGRTPGKRMAGVRIVNRLGGTPSTLALLIRNGFRLIDSLPLFYGVGLCTTLFSAQRVRLGDLAAGTLLVHDGDEEVKALAQLGSLSLNSSLDAGTVALGNDLLMRWSDLEPARRQELARELLRRIATAAGSAAGEQNLDALKDRDLKQRLRAALSGHPA
ncbi:MAG TPA: RDD family protein [Steroidobacteraceae bacterium]|nr:RDD family protein [Steroidobacteraceae bacterium]